MENVALGVQNLQYLWNDWRENESYTVNWLYKAINKASIGAKMYDLEWPVREI